MPVPSRPLLPSDRPTRPLTVVLRVPPSIAGSGRLAGTVEVVDTGELVPIAEVGDLLVLLARLAARRPSE